MLTAGVLKFDLQGRILLSSKPPVNFNGGTPTAADGGLAVAAGATPQLFLAAIGYLNNGALTDSNNPLVPQGPGVATNTLGQVRISTDPPVYWYAGLPLTAQGFLSTSPRIA